jgi:hypothetical protein
MSIKIILCPFCGSDDVYEARHDSDWGSSNSFMPINYQKNADIDLDLNTHYCHNCNSFGDFEKIHQLLITHAEQKKKD